MLERLRGKEKVVVSNEELKGGISLIATQVTEELKFTIGEGEINHSNLKTVLLHFPSSESEDDWILRWGKIINQKFEMVEGIQGKQFYPSLDDIGSSIQCKLTRNNSFPPQVFFSNRLKIKLDPSLESELKKKVLVHQFDVYYEKHQKKQLSLSKNRVILCNRVHSNRVHNRDHSGERLEISIDPSIQVLTFDNRNSNFCIRVRNQTFVNLEGLNAYGVRNDQDQLIDFNLEANSPFERDFIVLCLRNKFKRGRIHELDRSATPKDMVVSLMPIGAGKEFTMTENDWSLLSINSNEYFYEKGSVLFREGMTNRSLYRIIGGYVQIVKENKYVTIGRMGPGSIVGEMSLLGEGYATASVIAETDVRIAELSLDYIQSLFEVETDLALKLFHNLAIRLALRFQSLVNGRREQPAPEITPKKDLIHEEGAGFLFKRKNVVEAMKTGSDFMVIREYEGKHHKMVGYIQMHSHRIIFQTGFLGVVVMKIINHSEIDRIDSINRGSDEFGIAISRRGKRRPCTFFLSDEVERDKLVGVLERVVEKMSSELQRIPLQVPLTEAKKVTQDQEKAVKLLLKGQEREDWKELLKKTKRVYVPKGTHLITDGKPPGKLYEIVKGKCRIEKEGKIFGLFDRGQIVGEVSFLGVSPVYGSIIADSDVELIIIDAEELKQVIRKYPKIGTQFFKYVSQVLDGKITRGEDNVFSITNRI